jgi:hypothetical protein
MWQNNVSWIEGLFSEIPFKRFQTIKTKSQWDSPLAIFTRLNPNNGNDWPNLRFEGIQSPSSPTIRPFDTLFSPDYYIVAVDTRKKTTACLIDIKTQDNITGKVSVTIEYQVVSLETLLSIDDPLSRLKARIGEVILEFVSHRDYFSVNEAYIKDSLQMVEAQGETGISVKRLFNLQIIWPESITQRFQKDVLGKIDDKTQRGLNDLKIQKLKDFGINDPILIASVLGQSDTDFDVIMGHVRNASQAYKDQMDRDLSLLNWLKEKDLLTRADVQNVIESLTLRINDQSSPSPLLKGMLSSTNHDQQRLGSGETSKEEQGKEGQEGPKIISKRKINLSDK